MSFIPMKNQSEDRRKPVYQTQQHITTDFLIIIQFSHRKTQDSVKYISLRFPVKVAGAAGVSPAHNFFVSFFL